MLLFFFLNDTPTPETYTLSLHDALPICAGLHQAGREGRHPQVRRRRRDDLELRDRKSTRLNSSHTVISYAVFCLKKKTHPIVVTIDIIQLHEQTPIRERRRQLRMRARSA